MSIEELYQHYLNSKGVCTDSRAAEKGRIFFALRGESFNGNEYALEALRKGCSLAVVDDPSLTDDTGKLFPVDSVLETLQSLASYHRKQLGIPVLAITGSNGKTTTKELIHAVLTMKFRTLATKGNLNNHIGVPVTLLRLTGEDMAIIEMGANHRGEIHNLCTIADPDFGLITNIGNAHLEGFGSPEGVLTAKTEMYRFLEAKGGIVFVNGTNELLTRAASDLNIKTVWYMDGKDPVCDGYADRGNFFLSPYISFMNGGSYEVNTKLTGIYNLENILAAACVGKYFGVPEEDIIKAIELYTPSNNRSQVYESGKNKIIIDAYNANPTSMKGSVMNFLSLPAHSKVLILGDMLELGKYSQSEHSKILDLLPNDKNTRIFLVGPEFGKLSGSRGFLTFYVVEELIEHLRHNPVKDQLILLKGSRGIKLEKLLDVL